MLVDLPNKFDRVNMYNFIGKIFDRDMNPKTNDIIFDFTYLRFIEPDGVTVLSNIVGKLLKLGADVKFKVPARRRGDRYCPISYLDDSLFFKQYTGRKKYEDSTPRETTIPLSVVAYHDSVQWLERTILWLSRRLSLTTGSLANIKVCFEEIFNNINDHSSENTGCVFAQHYPFKNEIRVCFSDFGVGIPYNVRKLKPLLTDGQSIELATEYGFTTRSTERNGGRGLNTLIQNVVKNNKGQVYIHSNHGILKSTYLDEKIVYENHNHPGFYPGTLLDIVFRTDTIEEEEEEEFSW